MSMQRAQILFEQDQYERLRSIARASRRSIGTLVREAVDASYPGQRDVRAHVQKILELPEIELGDWQEIKTDLRSDLYPDREWESRSK